MISSHTTLCPTCNGERVVPDRVYGHLHEGLVYRPCDTCEGTGSVHVPLETDHTVLWFLVVLAALIGISLAIGILGGFHGL